MITVMMDRNYVKIVTSGTNVSMGYVVPVMSDRLTKDHPDALPVIERQKARPSMTDLNGIAIMMTVVFTGFWKWSQ